MDNHRLKQLVADYTHQQLWQNHTEHKAAVQVQWMHMDMAVELGHSDHMTELGSDKPLLLVG